MSQAFDVLEFANELVDSGFTEQQAHVLAHGLWRWADSQLASKQDIRDLKEGHRFEKLSRDLDRCFGEFEARIRLEFRFGMAEFKAEFVEFFVFAMIVQAGVISLLYKFLH